LIPYCKENNIGFIAMKVCSKGAIFKKGAIYSMKDCLDYVWSIPGVNTAIVGISNLEQLKRNLQIANRFKGISLNRMAELEQVVEPYANEALHFRKHHEWDNSDNPEFVL
jgi:aryl-alcohol dehydrogenase-like predicted oxidoreductase